MAEEPAGLTWLRGGWRDWLLSGARFIGRQSRWRSAYPRGVLLHVDDTLVYHGA